MQSDFSPEYMSKVALDVVRNKGDVDLIAINFDLPVSVV